LGFADVNEVLSAVNYRDLTAELRLSEDDQSLIELDGLLTVDNFTIV
jgi:predicted NUDIX family phosphoesterase